MNSKWVLITGAQGGIGSAIVSEFSDKGYQVIAADIVKCDRDKRPNVINYELDLELLVSDEKYAENFQKKVHKITQPDGISCLINNAAVQILVNTSQITRSVWNKTLNTNLLAPFFLSQMFYQDLKANDGAIVNISSIHATQTKKEFVAYATSKAALSAMTRNMVLDIGDSVRINAIEPAAIATKMLKAGFFGNEEKYRELEHFHPMRRIGLPEEVARLALFLCSDDAGFIQGACISASGGIQSCLSDPA
ncbi:SDR family oxidoreductase [Vibrio sp. AK197]